MYRFEACFVVAGVALLLTASIQAQTSQTTATTFTSSTELVLIPTVVNDKSGAHIAGLHKEEFALKQDGRSHPIAIFEEVHTDSTRMRRSAGEHGTFSNVEPGGSDYHRLNIIVLDFVNTPFADLANARDSLLKFLSHVAESGEPICLLALTRGGLTLLHDFTDDPKLLAAALRKAEPNNAPLIHESVIDPGHPITSDATSRQLTQLIREQLQSEVLLASNENKNTAFLTVQALQQIAKAFRGMPARKSLIWASSGFPSSLSSPAYMMCEPACPAHQRSEIQSAYDNLWRIMNDAQIAIYSVDLRLTDSGTVMSAEGVRPSDAGDPQFDTGAQDQWKRLDTTGTLQMFADSTGGKAFLGGGNLVESFRQATQDDRSYYMLGYYVSRSAKPGWHQISVTVSRKGARARYRNGFFLSTDTSAPSAQQDMKLALTSPFDFLGVPVSVTWSGRDAGKSAGKSRMKFDLVLPANFASVDESDQNHMVVDIAAAAKNLKGETIAELSQRIDAHLKPDGLEQIQHNGMTYSNGLQLPPGEYTVRFVVRDSIGNRTGSVAATIDVAP
jgi:VWFA-related protein